MNKSEFRKGIEKLELAYNQKFTGEKLKVWWDKLQTMDADKFYRKLDELIVTNKFMPNIAEILNKKELLGNYDQRDYSDFDLSYLYANKGE